MKTSHTSKQALKEVLPVGKQNYRQTAVFDDKTETKGVSLALSTSGFVCQPACIQTAGPPSSIGCCFGFSVNQKHSCDAMKGSKRKIFNNRFTILRWWIHIRVIHDLNSKPTPSSLELDNSTVTITTSSWEIPVFRLVISYGNPVELKTERESKGARDVSLFVLWVPCRG